MKMTTERDPRGRKTFLGILGVAVAAAMVLPTSAVGQTNTVVTSVTGRAYALNSTGELAPTPDPLSLIVAPPCPQTAGSPAVNLGGISVGVLATGAQCDGVDTPRGRFIRMTADVANATVAAPTGISQFPLLDAGEVHVECTADRNGVDGFTSISSLNIAGFPVNVGTFTTETDLSGVISEVLPGSTLIINEVAPENPDNPDSISINGIHLIVPAQTPPPPLPQTPTQSINLIIGHVECTRALGPGPTTTLPPGATTTLPPGATTTLPPGATTTLPPGATTTAPPGATTTAPPGATTTAPPGAATTTVRPPTGTLARTGATALPWLLAAAAAVVIGGIMRVGSAGVNGLATTGPPAPPVRGSFRPVRPEQMDARRRAGGPLDAAAADALAEMEGPEPTSE